MNRASPVELRKALDVAHTFAKAGINFVCIPVANATEQRVFTEHAAACLERMERQADSQAGANNG